MEPSEELRTGLTESCEVRPERVMSFSCGHVIAKEQLLPIAVTRGPGRGTPLRFDYESRCLPEMVQELGQVLTNLARIVPFGMVVFFPSYGYENNVFAILSGQGTVARIQEKKRLFREPKSASQVHHIPFVCFAEQGR